MRLPARGVTLIELVLAIVLTGIIVAATAFFVFPVRQGVDVVARAELTDIADNTLQRIGRDVRLALPNSVRVTTSGNSVFLEFLAVRAAGRYRADGGGASVPADCPDTGAGIPASDQLSFDAVIDQCFKTIGKVPTITPGDFLVLNNYGPGFTGQDAYATTGTLNRRQVTAVVSEASRERITFSSSVAFDRNLHDSPGKRFYVISGPVSYVCDLTAGVRTITRFSGYAIQLNQPVAFGSGALIAENVTDCVFEYLPNSVAPQIGLLTLRVTLARTLSGGGTETVNLYEAVHVNNLP